MNRAPLVALAILTALTAGCLDFLGGDEEDEVESYFDMGFDGTRWPSLVNHTVTVLHAGFPGFSEAKELFQNRTNATVVEVEVEDLQELWETAAADEKGAIDIIYGLDNMRHGNATRAGIYLPYKPLFSQQVEPQNVFFDEAIWNATPVAHGYTAVNVDHNHSLLANITIEDMIDVRTHADKIAIPDPARTPEGLGFLLSAVARFGENEVRYDWRDYMEELVAGGALFTVDSETAYQDHFSGGTGVLFGGLGDYPMVVAYTSTPAHEWYKDQVFPEESEEYEPGERYSENKSSLPDVLTVPDSTFHRIVTAGIAANSDDVVAAQAWIEWMLTDEFQELVAPEGGLYPVVRGIDTASIYDGVDPAPGTFNDATFQPSVLNLKVDDWIGTWNDICADRACL